MEESTTNAPDYLHQMFKNDIRAIVPQIAMSAGTMVACSCREIWMAKHSSLGPIDPQFGGIPAHGVIQEFERACEEVRTDPSCIPMWQAIIGRYPPAFLGRCENAIKWSNDFVRDQLVAVDNPSSCQASCVQDRECLRISDRNRTHERHIDVDECKSIEPNCEDDRKRSYNCKI